MTTKNDWTVMKDCGQELAEKIMAVVCDKTLDEDQAAAQAGNLYAAAQGGKPLFASLAMIVVGFEQMASPGLDFLEGLPDGELKAGLRRFIRITNAIPIPAMHAAIAEEHPQRAANLLRRLDSGSILSAWRDSGVVGGISWWGWRGSVSPNMIFAHCWYDASGSLSMENRYSLALLEKADGLGSWANALAQGIGREAAAYSVKEALNLCTFYRGSGEWDAALAVMARCDPEDLERFMKEQEAGFSKDAKTAEIASAEPSKESSAMSAMAMALLAGARKSASKAKVGDPSVERALATLIDPRRMLMACSVHSAEAMPWWRDHLSRTISAMMVRGQKNGGCEEAIQASLAIGAVSESFEMENFLAPATMPARSARSRI